MLFRIDMKNKKVKCIQTNISFYGKCFSKMKFYPAKEECVNFRSLREEYGFWFGLDLDDIIPINVHLFFFNKKWNTNCEYCERNVAGEWIRYFDSDIHCNNIKVKYIN